MADFTLSSENALGDMTIFARHKTAVFCSRRCPAEKILKIYQWAKTAHAGKICIMSGFHTPLECDIYDILSGGDAPLVEVCARGIPKKIPAAKRVLVDNGGLLIVSPFSESRVRANKQLAHNRNLFIIRHAQKTIIAHVEKRGRLKAALTEIGDKAEFVYL